MRTWVESSHKYTLFITFLITRHSASQNPQKYTNFVFTGSQPLSSKIFNETPHDKYSISQYRSYVVYHQYSHSSENIHLVYPHLLHTKAS